MRVAVSLYANLAKYAPPGSERRALMVDLEEGDTVAAVLRRLKMPRKERATILIEGRHANLDRPVRDGEYLQVFPPMCGG